MVSFTLKIIIFNRLFVDHWKCFQIHPIIIEFIQLIETTQLEAISFGAVEQTTQ